MTGGRMNVYAMTNGDDEDGAIMTRTMVMITMMTTMTAIIDEDED